MALTPRIAGTNLVPAGGGRFAATGSVANTDPAPLTELNQINALIYEGQSEFQYDEFNARDRRQQQQQQYALDAILIVSGVRLSKRRSAASTMQCWRTQARVSPRLLISSIKPKCTKPVIVQTNSQPEL